MCRAYIELKQDGKCGSNTKFLLNKVCILATCVTRKSVYLINLGTNKSHFKVNTNDLKHILNFKAYFNMHLLKKNCSLCIFESSRLVALFNSTYTNETALYNLNKVVHAYVLHIDGFNIARQIV